jgi:hypothetical protein
MAWQCTATTVSCHFVGDFATILVYADESVKCSYVNRCNKTRAGRKKLRNCKWPDCPLVKGFREKALAM